MEQKRLLLKSENNQIHVFGLSESKLWYFHPDLMTFRYPFEGIVKKKKSLVRLQNLVCAFFLPIPAFNAPGHKTLYTIANEKLLFCDVLKSCTSISQNYQF